jgi:hypothetical protein
LGWDRVTGSSRVPRPPTGITASVIATSATLRDAGPPCYATRRPAAATASRTGLPIIRPLCLTDPHDPRGWSIGDAYGYGPALWVAPVLDDGAREREVPLPRGEWIETWSGRGVRGAGDVLTEAPLEQIPVWVRRGSIVVSHPASCVARGLADEPEHERPLIATLWGEPPLGRAAVRLADGTRIAWRRGAWSVAGAGRGRETAFVVREV